MATAGDYQAILKFENDDRLENVDLKHLAKAVKNKLQIKKLMKKKI